MIRTKHLIGLIAVAALGLTSCGTTQIGAQGAKSIAKKSHVGLVDQQAIDTAALAALDELDPVPTSNVVESGDDVAELGDDFFNEDLDEYTGDVNDPIEPLNRVMFVFNDKLYMWVLDPLNKGYRKVMPNFAEKGLSNFFSNLMGPKHVINNLLQGDIEGTIDETGVFLCNSIFGLGGLLKLEEGKSEHREDFGQTLGKWGVGNGPYIVLPVLGPSSLRDSAGRFADYYTYPPNFVMDDKPATVVLIADNAHSMDGLLESYNELVAASIEPYEAMRQAYLEYRSGLIEQ